MAAFDKVKSGYPGMDDILDYIRMGDNVVWQVADIDEFRFFALPFVAQAKRDGRSITYIRFAQHAPILEDLDGVDLVEFDPDEGFEAFTVAIHNGSRARAATPFTCSTAFPNCSPSGTRI